VDHRQLYMEKVNAQIEQDKARIAEMRARAAEKNADVKSEYLREVEALENKLQALRENYGKLHDSDETAWESIKEATESAWESLTDSIAKATRRFRD
jgi:uncharacterized protein involved in exopolysaccharide biosynthesis